MPLVGFTCPSSVPTSGQQHDLDYCLGQCAHPCAAPPLLAAIFEANQRNYHKGAYLSASMLASDSCMRQTQYERMEPYYDNVQRLFWPFRGTIAHGLLEAQDARIRHYGWLQELKLKTELVFDEYAAPVFDTNGDWTGDFDSTQPLVVTINGTTDLYNPWTREIYDAKTMACAAASKFIKGDYKTSWEAQTNIYAWLASRTPLTDEFDAYCDTHGLPRLEGPNFPYPEIVRIQGISMMELPQTGRAYKPMRDSKIHMLPEIPLWPADRVEVFVRERAIEWFKVLVLGEKAPVVSKASSWLCVGGDTPVLTPKGYVPIKDLRIGEQVMTRKGWRSVVDGIARPATGKRVLRYKPFYGMPIYITDDHPILTTLYRHTVAQTQRDGTPEWRTLADLEHYEGMTPKVYLGYRTEERALPEGMTDAHLRLLGAYVADGSLIDWRPLKNGTKVPYKTTIVVGPDDTDIADAIVADVTEAFGGTVRSTHVVRHHRNTSSRVVTIYSRKVAEWLHRWCPGRRAPVKQLADEVLYWPVTSQTALVDAMMRGDGHVGREPGGTSTFTYSTASYQLALQVQELWFRRQLGAAINVRQQKGGFSKSGSTCYTVVHRAGAKATYGKFIAPGIVEVPIQSIEEAVWDTDALVYDITVDGEHEFMTAAGLVHNCKSCSFNGERIPGERCYPSSER